MWSAGTGMISRESSATVSVSVARVEEFRETKGSPSKGNHFNHGRCLQFDGSLEFPNRALSSIIVSTAMVIASYFKLQSHFKLLG